MSQTFEIMDLRRLTQYASVSEHTIRNWISARVDPLPAYRAGRKLLVRKAEFDAWLASKRVARVSVGAMLDDVVRQSKAKRGR